MQKVGVLQPLDVTRQELCWFRCLQDNRRLLWRETDACGAALARDSTEVVGAALARDSAGGARCTERGGAALARDSAGGARCTWCVLATRDRHLEIGGAPVGAGAALVRDRAWMVDRLTAPLPM